MLSMAPVRSAGGAATYFAADNYYTLEESAEASIWFGEGAEMLGLAPGEGNGPEAEPGLADEAANEAEADSQAQADWAEDAGAEKPDEAEVDPDIEQVPEVASEPLAGEGDGYRLEEASSPDHISGGPVTLRDGSADGPHTGTQTLPGSTGEVETGEGAGSVAQTDTAAIPFDPDLPGGGPAGVSNNSAIDISSATRSGAGQTGLSGAGTAATKPGNLALSNPSGKVDAKTFEAILNGRLPDGTQVGDPGSRALGMDLTFSMPKSASILALVGGDKRITDAHMAAVKSTIGWVSANLAEGRQKIDGRDVPVKTGNLVTAMFQHDTSRSLDPQSHIHVVIANMTRMANGSWRALHNGEIWKNNTVVSSIYHAAFRDGLEKLGYSVQLQGKHGTFEIGGVPKGIRDVFSQRRMEILKTASQLGTATTQGLREITKRSRSDKEPMSDRNALKTEWNERAAAHGFDPAKVIDQALARTDTLPSLLQRSVGAIETALSSAKMLVTDVLRKPSDPLIDTGVKRLMLTGPEARTQIATASAIRILSQREAAFGVHQLTKTALDLGLADVTPGLIATRMTELIANQQLVPGETSRADNVVTMLTTSESLATESGILTQIERGKGKTEPLVRADRAFEVLTGAAGVDASASGSRELNAGQMAAASAIVSSSDRIVAVQGLAGAGKSTMLAAVANVLDFENKPALGLAFQNKMVADLKDGTGLESQTIASFLIQHDALLHGGDPAKADASRAALSGIYLIVDEASFISNDQMHALVTLANKGGVDRLVLVGDRQQLLSIDAGKSFAMIQAGGVETSRMDENLRQRTPELRAIAALTNQGKAGEALKMLGTRVTETSDRVGEAAAHWLNLSVEDRAQTMVFTSGRETRAAVNAAIQTGLKAEGTLTGQGLTLTVKERVSREAEELRYAHSYQPGLSLEVWGRLQSVGLERGEYRVTRVFQNGKVEAERNGKRISFDPQKLASGAKSEKLNLVATKEITIHEGDTIRWTANDKPRDLLSSQLGKVVGIDASGVVIERGDNSVVRLPMSDPMLARMDLAYALNMHMAQGITTDKGVVVMGSEERFLSNQRLFHVAVTRVRDGISVITDDKDKLARQLDRTTGDKYSSLEEAGRLSIDSRAAPERGPSAPFDPDRAGGLGLASDAPAAKPEGRAADIARTAHGPGQGRDTSMDRAKDTGKAAQQLPLPEKSKGLEL